MKGACPVQFAALSRVAPHSRPFTCGLLFFRRHLRLRWILLAAQCAGIKMTMFITSFDEITELRQVLYRNYGEHLPASSLVEVSRLFSPDLKIEIEAILGL